MTRNPVIGNLPPKDHSIEHFGSSNHDRVLNADTYFRALEFINLMNLNMVEQRPSQVIKNAAYALQFALKAALLYSGNAENWIERHIGRDLEAAMALAASFGMPPPTPEFAGVLPELSRYHAAGRNFGHARILSVMTSRHICENVLSLIEVVGEMIEIKTNDRADM
ncbi:hypothetical protein [Novosphingobium guangzhouense]|uniref:hypothetical protein n=1 Tax=Novosphingobium guangzhouense TaxID=1850347 RepID=UPI0011AFD1F5|nr:hypothetical protein [Novosphingobium guangzhouense]